MVIKLRGPQAIQKIMKERPAAGYLASGRVYPAKRTTARPYAGETLISWTKESASPTSETLLHSHRQLLGLALIHRQASSAFYLLIDQSRHFRDD